MTWDYRDAERHLSALEPVGWRFGLDRIRRLLSVLGMPQHRFASIHVVGTNGKSSVAEAVAALLEAHGLRAGAYLSPHLERWSERVRIGGGEIEPARYAAAVERAVQGAEAVARTLADDDEITQFELSTAAAFLALADDGVAVAAVEAGLGGRLDATNVLPSRVSVLTSVSLEHTDLLGETEEEIATEKLDVLRPHSTLVLGEVSGAVGGLAERIARQRSAALVRGGDPDPEWGLPGYAGRNLAVARAAVEAFLGGLDAAAVDRAVSGLALPGRLELRPGEPPLVLDAAHNPGGARALADALPEVAGGRPVVACLAVLEGKDAEGIARELAGAVEDAVCTEVPAGRLTGVGRPGARSLPGPALADACGRAGLRVLAVEPRPDAALRRARARARELGGVTLLTGTHYLLGYAEDVGGG